MTVREDDVTISRNQPAPGPAPSSPEQVRAFIDRAAAQLGGPASLDSALVDAEEAAAGAAELGDQSLALDALETRAQILTAMGDAAPEDWLAVEHAARGVGALARAASALRMQALRLLDDHAPDAEAPAARLADLAAANGMPGELAWAESLRGEIAFVAGRWDEAVTLAMRAVAAAGRAQDPSASLRGWHVVIPITAARRDDVRLGLVYYPYTLRQKVAADTPYRRLLDTAAQLRFSDFGLADPPSLDPGELLAATTGAAAMPHWLAALETVIEAWIADGEFAAAEHALESMSAASTTGNTSGLGAGVGALLRARLLGAEGSPAPGVASHAWRALELFSDAKAPWWTLKAIRVLARVKEAPAALKEQGKAIERALGLP